LETIAKFLVSQNWGKKKTLVDSENKNLANHGGWLANDWSSTEKFSYPPTIHPSRCLGGY
jgi:hypothetical protein